MLCSKCKILSIHVPNFDSYLCEFGHVLCRSCSPKPENQCGICKGRIIRRAELLIEGVPRTIFRRTPFESYGDKTSDVRTDDGVNVYSETDEDWSRIFDFSDLKDYDGNSFALSTANLLDVEETGINDHPNYNAKILKTKRSACQFKTPSNESIRIREAIDPSDDPKEIYLKTLSGKVSPAFDPMRDYYERTAHVHTIQEYYKRPNLLISTKSSSKMDIIGGYSSDSSTVMQHLTEFRKATNYVPPSNVSAYKINNQTMFEPAMITTSKPKLTSRIQSTKQSIESPKKNFEEDISYQQNFRNSQPKLDIETEPQNIANSKPPEEQNDHDLPSIIDTNRKKINSSQQSLLREQLRHQVYSQFDSTPKQPKNVFMLKDSSDLRENPPPQIKGISLTTEENNLTDTINSEVERVIRNLSSFNKLPTHASLKRDEIVKQSKETLRQRIMEEVYSRFENSTKIRQENKHNSTSKIPNETSDKPLIVRSTSKLDSSDQRSGSHPSVQHGLHEVLSGTESKSVAMSTESYPKLNPDLSAILPSRSFTSGSHSVHNFEKPQSKLENIIIKENSILPTNDERVMAQDIPRKIIQKSNVESSIESLNQEENLVRVPQLEETPAINAISLRGAIHEKILQESEVHASQSEISANGRRYANTDNIVGRDDKVTNDAGIYEKDMNIYYFHQPPVYSIPTPFITPFRDEHGNVNIKNIAKNLVDDFKDDQKHSSELALLDMNKFLEYINQIFPKISLNQLKDIIINLPLDGHFEDVRSDLQIVNPPTVAFRSDEKSLIQSFSSEKLIESQKSENPADLSGVPTTTAYRAYFCPPINFYSDPAPQLKPINRFEAMPIVDESPMDIRAAAELNLPRSPITCPVTACRKLIFVSEFSKHIKMDHVKIPVETLTPGRCRNIFLDPRSNDFGVSKCHVLYLVTDKIRDLGSKEFKDYLPLLVMATKFNLLQLISPLCISPERHKSQNYLMIWLTGLCPNDLPVNFSLTAWHRYSPKPKCHMVHAGRIYSIRDKHDDLSVFNSGNAMILSENQVHFLTNNGKDMIELQVTVH